MIPPISRKSRIARLRSAVSCRQPRFERLHDRLCTAADLGLRADYFDAAAEVFRGDSLGVATPPVSSRLDTQIDFDWGTGSPQPTVMSDQFAVRWSGQLRSPRTGEIPLRVTTAPQDRVRLWVNGQLWIDRWNVPDGSDTGVATGMFVAGDRYDVRLDYVDPLGAARVKLEWKPAVTPGDDFQVIPAEALYAWSQPMRITEPGIYVGSW